jgi:hypothetical protein
MGALISTLDLNPAAPTNTEHELLNAAANFGVLSGGNQPRATLPGEHKQEHATPRVLRSGIAQQFPVHVSDGDVVSQEANIDLVELHRTVLEDSVIGPISVAKSWLFSRNNPVAVGMPCLYGGPACPQHNTPATLTNSASGARSLPNASLSWRFQVVANPATALLTSSAVCYAARTRLSERQVNTATAASTAHKLRKTIVIAVPCVGRLCKSTSNDRSLRNQENSLFFRRTSGSDPEPPAVTVRYRAMHQVATGALAHR